MPEAKVIVHDNRVRLARPHVCFAPGQNRPRPQSQNSQRTGERKGKEGGGWGRGTLAKPRARAAPSCPKKWADGGHSDMAAAEGDPGANEEIPDPGGGGGWR